MNIPFLSSFLKKNKKILALPESLLIKKLKYTSKKNKLPFFQDITIYHHNTSLFIPLLIIDNTRGIYLFEYKDWSYDDLKNAQIEKTSNQNASEDTLSYEKSHIFIKKRFNELKHNDGVPIFNYLLMENLNFYQYEHLDESFKELLPRGRIMFNDSSSDDILEKMIDGNRVKYNLPSASSIMSTLLTQYAILDNKDKSHLASNEQIEFINANLTSHSILNGLGGTGKTSIVLLKAILEMLKNPKFKILIIKPNNFSCDILKKKLLEMIERAIVEIDLTSIQIITPYTFINYPQKYVDLLICDDSWVYSKEFVNDIVNINTKKHLIIVENTHNNKLDKNHRRQDKTLIFHNTNQHAKALQIIASLLKNNLVNDILIFGSDLARVKLKDDLEYFVIDEITLLDTNKNLVNQNLKSLILSSYEDIHPLEAKFVILMNICFVDPQKLEYAFNLSTDSVFILYDTPSDNLTLLRNNFESNKNN